MIELSKNNEDAIKNNCPTAGFPLFNVFTPTITAKVQPDIEIKLENNNGRITISKFM
jgi:hypothetical protein